MIISASLILWASRRILLSANLNKKIYIRDFLIFFNQISFRSKSNWILKFDNKSWVFELFKAGKKNKLTKQNHNIKSQTSATYFANKAIPWKNIILNSISQYYFLSSFHFMSITFFFRLSTFEQLTIESYVNGISTEFHEAQNSIFHE